MAIEYNQTLFSRFFFLFLTIIMMGALVSLFRVLRQLHRLEKIKKAMLKSEDSKIIGEMANDRKIKTIFGLINSLDEAKKYKLVRLLEKEHHTMKHFGFPMFVGTLLETENSDMDSTTHQVINPTPLHVRKLRNVALFLLYQPYIIMLAAVTLVILLFIITEQYGITFVELSIGAAVFFVVTEHQIRDIKFVCDLFINELDSKGLISRLDWHQLNLHPLITHVKTRLAFFAVLTISLVFMTVNLELTINMFTVIFVNVLGYLFFVLALPLTANNPLFILIYMFVVLVVLMLSFRLFKRFFGYNRRKR